MLQGNQTDDFRTNLKILISTEQIQKRVKELARQITEDYKGKTIHAVSVLENGFMFTADLVRAIELPVVCLFIKPEQNQQGNNVSIFFTPELDVKGQHVILIEALVQSGVTSEFLIRNLMGRGAESVKLVTFLDKQSERRVSLQPDYFGFLIDESYVVGYGLGAPQVGRNLPYIASTAQLPAMTAATRS